MGKVKKKVKQKANHCREGYRVRVVRMHLGGEKRVVKFLKNNPLIKWPQLSRVAMTEFLDKYDKVEIVTKSKSRVTIEQIPNYKE